MPNKCPKCHHENPDDTIYCGKCTTLLKPSENIEVTETIEVPKEELTRGITFAGRYEIIEELGKGGMGRVYRVEDTKLKQEVALKLLKPEISKDRTTIERFRNELKLARNIRHKNVCGMYDLGEKEGAHFIAMEYVRGEDLRSSIRRFGQLPIGKSISIAKQICEGLAEAHRLGVVHRDLKSNNIMIDKEGNVRIMDFGIARSLEAKGITGAGVIIGTPEYMSPEQVEGKEVDERSDIYSLGIVLYEMVVGRVPFEGETPLSIALKHKDEIPKDPKKINTQIPDDLNTLILRCMEKDKIRRYQTAKELLSELEKIGEPELEKIKMPEWKNSIAVLPFTNMSADPEQEYFCDGMAEEIINALTHVESLRVIARTSTFVFKGKQEDIREIGKKLDVKTLLEGSVRKAGNRLRITAQLVNAADGSHLWSERYDRNLEDVFDIQDEISMAIVENLKVKLLKREKAAIIKRPTDDLEAYQLYIKGRFFINQQFTHESFSKAIECFKEAIERDPSFALAYIGIVDSYVWLCIGAGVSPAKNAKQEAREAALKAIELDSDLAEAHASLGMFVTVFDWDRVVAGKSFQKALDLSPNSSDVLMWYAQYLVILEHKFEKAIELFKRALELNPLQLLIYTLLSNAYSFIPQFDRGIQEAQKLLSLDPNHYFGYHILGENYLGKRLYKKAIANYEQAIRLGGRSITNIAELGFAHALAGNTNKAMDLLKETEEAVCQSNLYYAWVGLIYVGLGQNDKAFEWFEKAYEEHDPFLVYIPSKKWPKLEKFRRDPRFKALLKKMGVAHLA